MVCEHRSEVDPILISLFGRSRILESAKLGEQTSLNLVVLLAKNALYKSALSLLGTVMLAGCIRQPDSLRCRRYRIC